MKKILLSTIVVAVVLGSIAWFMRIEILLQLVSYRYPLWMLVNRETWPGSRACCPPTQ